MGWPQTCIVMGYAPLALQIAQREQGRTPLGASDFPESTHLLATDVRPGRRETARRRRESRRGILFRRIYAAGLILCAAGFLALVMLADTHTILTFDVVVTRAIQAVHLPLYRWALVHESDLGFAPLSPLTFIAVFALLYALGQRLDAVLAVLSAATAGLLGGAVKLLVARVRPSPIVVHVTGHVQGYGFPSGHVIHYTTLFGFAFYAILVARPRSWWRDLTLAVLALLILLVGPSRVYLGQHWPTDALGGYLLAGLWLAGTIEVQRLALGRRQLANH
jgi:membrane-associated phospholipid phosphatase